MRIARGVFGQRSPRVTAEDLVVRKQASLHFTDNSLRARINGRSLGSAIGRARLSSGCSLSRTSYAASWGGIRPSPNDASRAHPIRREGGRQRPSMNAGHAIHGIQDRLAPPPNFVYTELCTSGTRGRPRSTAPSMGSRRGGGDRVRRSGWLRWPGSGPLRGGVAIPATRRSGDQPRAHRGVYREEARPWREHPHHQRAPGEPQGAGGLCAVPGLTSPTSRRLPPRSSARCAVWGGPPWGPPRGD